MKAKINFNHASTQKSPSIALSRCESDKVDLRAFLLILLPVFLLFTGCATDSNSSLKPTDVPGAFYYTQNLDTLNTLWIHGSNQTDDWVTYFVFIADSGGTVDLYNLVAQGMPVSVWPLYAHQDAPLASTSSNGYFCVWARSGKLTIRNNQIVPE